jgi:hypothetical protein
MADNGTLEGSIDEAAAAIEALLSRPAQSAEAPAEGSDAEEQAVADQIQAKGADQPAQAATDTGEEAPEGDTPAELPAEGESLEAAVAEPEPVKPAPKVETPQAVVTQPQANNLSQTAQNIATIRAQIAGEFPDIRTIDDLARLATEDPARYVRFDFQTKRLQQEQQVYQSTSSAAVASWRQAEAAQLASHPDFSDPVKGPELEQRVIKHAIEKLGYSRDDINRASARDVLVVYEAMQLTDLKQQLAAEKAKTAKAIEAAKEKAKDAPRVQKPGVAVPGPSKAVEKEQELLARIEKSGGKVNDVAALIEHRNR